MKLDDKTMSVITVMLIAALIGFVIVKTVDAHLGDISINMPSIKFPEQKITVKIDGDTLPVPASTHTGTVIYNSLDTLKKDAQETMQIGGGTCGSTMPNRTDYDASKYRSESKSISKPTIIPPPATADHEARPAPVKRELSSLTEPQPEKGHMGHTYYKDPKEMTPAQLVKFQERAKFTNMTVKDYANWLLTFRDIPEKLTGFHRANLKVLIRGGQLEKVDMPIRMAVPDGARDQYTKIMHDQVQDNIPQPEFLGYQPSNYESQIGSPMKKNRNLRHLDYINPDEPLKTWILTHGQDRFEKSAPSQTEADIVQTTG